MPAVGKLDPSKPLLRRHLPWALLAVFVLAQCVALLLAIDTPTVAPLIAAMGVLALLGGAVVGLRRASRSRRADSPETVLLVVVYLLLPPITLRYSFSEETATRVWLAMHEARLRSAVNGTSPCPPSVSMEVDRGFVAFRLSDGVLDNWSALVFSPGVDLVAQRQEHESLFGGRLWYCSRLGDGWHYCLFT